MMATNAKKHEKTQELQADVVAARQQGPVLIAKLMDKELNIFARCLQETKYLIENPKQALPNEIRGFSFIINGLAETTAFNIVEKEIELNARTDNLLQCMELMKKRRKD